MTPKTEDRCSKRERELVAEIRILKSQLARAERNQVLTQQDPQSMNQVLLDAMPWVAMLVRPQTREIVAMNEAAQQSGAVIGESCFHSWARREDPCPECMATEARATGQAQHCEAKALGRLWEIHWRPVSADLYLHYAFDITERKHIENEHETLINLMELLSDKDDLHGLMHTILGFIREWFGCEAVGIRLRQGEDFPYYETSGFSDEFVEVERHLCVRDLNGQLQRDEMGRPVLECMCGNIICGRFDPSKPFFTDHGSFVSNCTTELLASTSEEDRQSRTRNRCNGEGYESVMLIPLRIGGKAFGLLQFNDRRTGCFSDSFVSLAERLADSVAHALAHRQAEAALLESKTQLEQANQIMTGVLDHTHMMAVLLDPQFNFVWVNTAYARTCRHEPSFFPGKNHFELYPHTENQAIFQQVVDTGEPFFVAAKPFEFPDQPERGVTYWDWSLIPVSDNTGRVTGLVFTLAEVTERVHAEERYTRIIQTSRDGFAAICPSAGRFLDVNDATCRMLGYERDELLGMRIADIEALETPEAAQAHIEAVIAQSYAQFETQHRRKDGTIVDVEVHTHYVPGEGHFVSFFHDITQRRKAEAEQTRLQANLQSLWGLTQLADDDLKTLCDYALHQITECSESEYGFYGFLNADETVMTLHAWSPQVTDICAIQDKPIEYPIDQAGQWAEAVRQRRTLLVNDYAAAHPGKTGLPVGHIPLTRVLAVPIFSGDQIVAIGAVANKKTPYTNVDCERIQGFLAGAQTVIERKQTQSQMEIATETLRRSQEQYRAVVEDTPVLICRFLPDGKITYSNKAYCKYFRKTLQELTGSSFLMLIPDSDRETVWATIAALTVDSPTQSHEHRVIGPDHETYWQRWTNRALFDIHGKIVDYQSIGEDITERKVAEEARLLLETGIEQAAEAVVITDTEGIIQYVNPAFETITEYSQAEVLGQNPRFLQSGRHNEEFYKKLWATVTSGKTWYGEFVNCRKDSGEYYEKATISPVKDGNGKVVNYIAIKEDITERKLMADALQEQQAKAQTYLDIAGVMIVALDGQGNVTLINKKGCVLLGWDESDIVGKNWFDNFLAEGVRAQVKTVYQELMAGHIEPVEYYENSIRQKDGNERLVAWYNTVLRDENGKITGILSSGEDITKRKQVEQKLHDNQAQLKSLASELVLAEERERNRLAVHLHDDVCQNLAYVKMRLQIVSGALEDRAQIEDLAEVIDTLTRLMQDVRSLTFELCSPVLMEFGLEAAISEWLAEQIEQKHGIDTKFNDDGQAKPLVRDIQALLFRSVRELLVNVVKHSKAKRVEVSICREEDQIVVRLEDDGIGFAPDKVVIGKDTGGFGLFSIRERLSQMEGSLEIDSSPGQGCKSILRAPLQQS